jgi:hypothetical protein
VDFSRKALVDEAVKAGYSNVSERLITDWASIGLLDRPERTSRGKGKGRGAFYVWSDKQRDLFLALLQQREQLRYVGGLASLPVSTWLYWSDEWIPLRQAKLALKTYWDRAGVVRSIERAEEDAWTTVDAIAGKNGSRETRLAVKKEIVRGLVSGRFDEDRLTPLIDELLQSLPGGAFGPFRNSAEDLVKFIQSFAVAMEHFDSFADGDFYRVRAYTRELSVSYVREQPRLSRHPKFGDWFEDPSYEKLVNSACRDVMRGLGMLYQAQAERIELPPVPLVRWTKPPIELTALPLK